TMFTSKHLAIVTKHLFENKPILRYLGMIELDDCGAESITANLKRFILAKLLNIEYLIHFGSDGASTILGHQNGVAACLKKYNPFITKNHCIAHRLHLAGQDAAEKVLYFAKYEKLVKGIYTYFSSSYKWLLALKMVQNTLEEPKLMILNIVSTRWLSLSNVIYNFHQNLELIKGALLDEAANNTQAATLLADIDQTFKIITMFLADYFFIIDKLICIFQSEYISFIDIKQYIIMACDALQAQFIGNNDVLPTYGKNLLKYMDDNNLDITQTPIFISE
ncbi:45492_t:CDS:1, partial [Gigaspora margarita]